MENLEQQKKIISLGKLFVNELKLEPGVDTFSRWMSHYIAEKIFIIEQSEGCEKKVAQKECFDVILQLWEHRHSLPAGRRPFQSFEHILNTLSKLNPDVENPYFYNAWSKKDLTELEIDNLEHKSGEEWTNIAKEIDKTARIWIEYALSKAANNAKNERTKEWIENTVNLSNNDDADIISDLLDNILSSDKKYNDDDFSKKYNIEKLKKRISQLKKYSKLNETLLKAYESELEEKNKF